MAKRGIAGAVVLALVLIVGATPVAAGQTARAKDVPKVVGLRLDKAAEKLQKAGFRSVKFIDRRSHRAVVRKKSWYVVDQSPKPGVVVVRTTQVRLGVLKNGEKVAPPKPKPAPVPTAPSRGEAQAVRSVTDGDTIVLVDGRRVRLAQVDAPEATSRRECYGDESTKALAGLVSGKSVTLRRPSDGPARDRYGRTLAEISVDGRSVNEALVRMGAAEWYDSFKSEDLDLARRLEAAENEARSAGRGLWSACAPAAPKSPPATTAPRPSTTVAAPVTGGACHPAYPDDCIPPAPPDLNCADIGRGVRVDHRYGDPHGFDGNDNDGLGCESYG